MHVGFKGATTGIAEVAVASREVRRECVSMMATSASKTHA
jgi:hypothetical protein